MGKEDLVFKEGDFLALSQWSYDDYIVYGFFQAKKGFDMGELSLQWLLTGGADTGRLEFEAWLSRHGYLEELSYREVHTGSYGEHSLKEYK